MRLPPPRRSTTCGLLLAAAGALPAQAPPALAPPARLEPLVALVMQAAGAPVADATAELLPQPARQLPALAGLGGLLASPTPAPLRARTDAKGVLRVAAAHTPLPTVSGLVTTTAGLGGLLLRLVPGRAQRLSLQPLGNVTTATGSEAFTLFARAHLPTGETITLPPQHGTAVRLPAADYEVWARGDDGWVWQRLRLSPGAQVELRFPGSAERLVGREGWRCEPLGWPGLDLLSPAGDAVLRGDAVRAFATAIAADHQTGALPLAGDPTQPWPPPTTNDLALAWPDAPAGAVVAALQRSQADEWRLLAAARFLAGNARVPTPPAGEIWLLRLAPGMAPLAVPWSPTARPRFDGRAGMPLRVAARDRTGTPIADLRLEYEPEGMAAATVAATSDERGRADLGPCLGPGLLRISDPRYRNAELALPTIPADELTVTVDAGETLAGTLRWPDGSAATGAVVTLRDSQGRLRPASRALAIGADGAFAFAGLPEDRPLVLFATAQRGGRTHTARAERQRAGGESVALVLRDEDPELQPAGR